MSKDTVTMKINEVSIELSKEDAAKLTQPLKLYEGNCVPGWFFLVMATNEKEAYDKVIIEDGDFSVEPLPFGEAEIIEHGDMAKVCISGAGIRSLDEDIKRRCYENWKEKHGDKMPHEL